MGATTKDVLQFSNAYNKYYSLIFSAIYSKIYNYDEAQDICQEVFMRFFQKYDGNSDEKKWLMWTMRYVMFEFYRKRGKLDEDIENFYNDMELSYVNGFKEVRVVIQETLDKIDVDSTDKSTIIFKLFCIHNYTFREIAKEFKIPYSQVKYKYNTLKSKVIDELKKRGIKKIEDLL